MSQISKLILENFRIFQQETIVNFAPITVITGANNSGKSTLIKAILYLKENLNDNSLSFFKLSFNSDLNGSISNYIPVADKSLKISLGLKEDTFFGNYLLHDSDTLPSEEKLSLEYKEDEKRNLLRLKNCTVEKKDGDVIQRIHISEMTDQNELFLQRSVVIDEKLSDALALLELNLTEQEILVIRNFIDNYFKRSWILYEEFHYSKNLLDYKEVYLDNLKNAKETIIREVGVENYEIPLSCFNLTLNECIQNSLKIKVSDKEKIYLVDLIDHEFFKRNIPGLHNMNNTLNSIVRLKSIKATPQTIFQVSNNDATFEGVLNNVIFRIGSHDAESIGIDEINRWIKFFGFGEEILLQTAPGFGNVVFIVRDGRKINISDMGTGTIQIVSLILFCFVSFGKTILIEEPEINLHPDLQSKLADLIEYCRRRYDIKFIIETHSEYLIRKLQYLVAKGSIVPDQIIINYFNDPYRMEKDEEQVVEISIEPDGNLSNGFGKGFFDEATNLQFELYQLQHSQSN